MNVLQIISEWRNGPKYSNASVRQRFSDLLKQIEQAEQHRLKLERQYMPTTLYKLSAVSLSNAVTWCMKNGQAFDIDTELSTPMFVVAKLTPIHVGLLKQIHVEGIPYEPKPPVIHDTSEPDAIDYERIG